MDRAERIGVAGYMGAGKSALCACFGRAGYLVIDADSEARNAMEADKKVRCALAQAFGPECTPGTTIDSRKLGAIAFASKDNLTRLNEIVRPLLERHFDRRLNDTAGQPVVLDAALLPLWKTALQIDRLFWVRASFTARLERLKKKSGGNSAMIEHRMRLQQQIIAEPTGDRWTTVENDGTPGDLEAIAKKWISFTPDKRRSS